MTLLSHLFSAIFVASLCLSGCATKTASPIIETSRVDSTAGESEAVDATAAPAADEPSVHPGINDPYFRPDALSRYTRILEADSREIVQRRSDIVDAMGLRAGMVVADIGAGTGLLTTEIAERVGERGKVYAVDIVPEFLEKIRRRVDAQGLRNVVVVLGEERATGLRPGSVDLAFMCDTYHHLEFPEAYMSSVLQSLRPGATLVLVDMKRVDGESSASVLKHVRAGKSTTISEVEQAGFVLESETELLEENYYLRFRRP